MTVALPSFVLACLVAVITASGTANLAVRDYELPQVSFEDLLAATPAVSARLMSILSEVGALEIVNIPGYEGARKEALGDLGSCLSNEKEAPTMIMPDGSKRISAGAASVHGKAGAMSSDCGDKAGKLRSLVDYATHQLFVTLDKTVVPANAKEGGMAK